MNDTFDDLRHVRTRICDLMLLASAVLAAPTATASVLRYQSIGWQWAMGVHVATAIALCLLFVFRASIPYTVRAGSIVFLLFMVGSIGFWNMGMIAGANPLLLLSPVFATILFGKRLGIPLAILMIVAMILTAYSFVFGDRVLEINFDVSLSFLPSWITYLMTVVMAVVASVVAISMSNHHLESALIEARKGQTDLANLNKDLENQVRIRTLELQDATKTAEQQARTDVLTGLNNRRAFFEYADVLDAQSRRYNHTYVIAMIDIDHFKLVNDTWGHECGDITLVEMATSLEQALRETDIIGRIGGEEFAIIMPETTLEEAALLAERLRELIEGLVIKTAKGEIKVTASIGIAAFEDPSFTVEKVIGNSDTALYRAKNAGRNRVELHREGAKKTIKSHTR
jgi:diguanylate cyclase (GGDEF)-like protein